MRALETSLSRPHQNRNFGWSETENGFAVPGDYLKHRLSNTLKSHFGLPKRKKMISKCHGSTWNTVLSTSSKSNFGLV